MRTFSFRQLAVGAALALTIGSGGAIGVSAQDSTPTDGYPAHILEGTCSDLSLTSSVELLNLLPLGVERDDNGETSETPEVRGTLTVGDLTYSESDDIEFEWEAMLGAPHAIVVFESTSQMENYIACGDIGGVVFDDGGEMVIGLKPVGDSGYSGISFLSQDDDGEVDVEVYLSGPAPDASDDGTKVVATPEG